MLHSLEPLQSVLGSVIPSVLLRTMGWFIPAFFSALPISTVLNLGHEGHVQIGEGGTSTRCASAYFIQLEDYNKCSPRIMNSGHDSLPPGVQPPLAGQSASDHSGASVVVTGLFLTIALASVGIKLYARISRRNGISYDDYTLILAWVRVLWNCDEYIRRLVPV